MATLKDPGHVHHALSQDLHGILGRYGVMPQIEQIAILAQVIGHVVAEMPSNAYSTGEVMGVVAMNIAAGNASNARGISSAIIGGTA